MTIKTWNARLFGGRDVGVTYDDVAGTLTILNQSISLSSLTLAQQAEWVDAANSTPSYVAAPFGGSNVGRAIGNILDMQPTCCSAVKAAFATYVSQQDSNGHFPDADSWRW